MKRLLGSHLSLCSICLVLHLFSAHSQAQAYIPLYSLREAEIQLLEDSSDAEKWADYGWSLLKEVDSAADWAFRRAFHEDALCSSACRGLAAVEAANGNHLGAIAYLESCSEEDTLSSVMIISILQYTGETAEADSILSLLEMEDHQSWAGYVNLLKARQARLHGDSSSADHQLQLILSDSTLTDFHPICKIERSILTDCWTEIRMESMPDVIEFDLLFLGCVYLDLIQKSVGMGCPSDQLLHAKIERIRGNYDSVISIVSSLVQEDLPLTEKVWIAYCLAEDDRYAEAMEITDALLEEDSSLTSAWCLKAVLLLRNRMNYEAYNIMDQALPLTDFAPECMALRGLAAEFSGEGRLTAESFAPLLNLSSDSVVLINRMRSFVYDEDLNYNFDYENYDDFSASERNWISGSFNLNYSNSTGEIEQSNFGLSTDIRHYYGLYGSHINASAGYSRQKWPGSTETRETVSALISFIHHNRYLYYSSVQASWNLNKYDISRWKIGLSASLGRTFELLTSLDFSLELGAGRQLNRWDSDGEYEASWIGRGFLSSYFSGRMYQNYLPDLSLSFSITQDLTNLSRYDIYGSADLSFSLSRLLSLSTGYFIEYLSAMPPEYEDISNGSTYVRLSIKF